MTLYERIKQCKCAYGIPQHLNTSLKIDISIYAKINSTNTSTSLACLSMLDEVQVKLWSDKTSILKIARLISEFSGVKLKTSDRFAVCGGLLIFVNSSR